MKKIFQATLNVLLLVFLMFVVSACGNQGDSGKTEPADEPTAGEQETEGNQPTNGGEEETETVAPETPVVKTVTFKVGNEVIDTVEYVVGETTKITEPTVPAKEHYSGVWESYTLGSTDIVVNAIYNIDLLVKSGNFDYSNGTYFSTQANALAVDPNVSFSNGTLSMDLKKVVSAEDSGIIFGLADNDSQAYWEGDGISYYFFFINQNGAAYLAKSVNGQWQQLGKVVDVLDYNEEDVYPLSVSKDNGLIRCYVGDECLIKYYDANPLAGTKVGYRLQEVGTTATPIQYSSEIGTDNLETEDYYIAAGNLTNNEGTYVTTADNTLGVAKDLLMADNVKYSIEFTPNNPHDGGLVFGLNDNGYCQFYEEVNSGIYYYMLMINFDGVILFAKIDGRTDAAMWTTLYDKSNIKGMDFGKAYTLSVVTNGNNVKGYVDDMLVFSKDVADTFVGTKLGFRSARSGASYSTITTSTPNEGYEYYQRSGQFVNENGTLSTAVDGGLVLVNNAALTTGTISVDIVASEASDTGIIFGCADQVATRWEEQPYYFFFVNVHNDALLAGPVNGWTTFANGGNVSEYMNPYGESNTLTVEIHENYLIKCYVNGHLVIKTIIPADSQLTGTYAGIRCGGAGTREFSNITITDTVVEEVVKKVIFMVEGAVVQEVEYIVGETKSITEPSVPAKENYIGYWDSYELGTDDVIVEAIYEVDPETLPKYTVAAGSFEKQNGVYVTTADNTLGVAVDMLMEDNVKYSVEFTPHIAHDGGLVFGLNDNGQTSFFENVDSGIYYYILMVNAGGVILFAKIDGRTDAQIWTTIYDNSGIKDLVLNKAYTLSVVTNGNNVKGFVDDMLVFSKDVADTFVGTKLGFRSQLAGASYSSITTSTPNEGYEYYQRSGQFVNENGTLSTTVDGGLVWVNNATLTTGTISVDIVASQSSDTGIIFGCEDPIAARWEERPYYFFFVNFDNLAFLAGPTAPGWKTYAEGGNVSEYMNPYGEANNFKVEIYDNFLIKCYVNGHLVIETQLDPEFQLTGTYVGVRCNGAGLREFANIAIIPSENNSSEE